MHVASNMPPAPHHTKLYQCIRTEIVAVVRVAIVVLHAALHLRKSTRGQGKFKGSGPLADPRVSSMQARSAPEGRVREILRVMQFRSAASSQTAWGGPINSSLGIGSCRQVTLLPHPPPPGACCDGNVATPDKAAACSSSSKNLAPIRKRK